MWRRKKEKGKKSYPDEEGRKKKERKKEKLEEWRTKKERKDEYVGVGGKGAYVGRFRFFVFFFSVTYSRVFEKRGYRSP